MSQSTNLFKSPEGWVRLNARRASGVNVRGRRMEYRPMGVIGEAVKSGKAVRPKERRPIEGESVERGGRKLRRVRIES